MTCIVAVAAPIGGGKTALVNGLAQALNGASTLYFDHYELATEKSPAELANWLSDGADFNQLSAPGLREALEALKNGQSVFNPVSGVRVLPGDYIVLEMPLGRAYAETEELIDIVIWVDIPLDVALARKVREMVLAVIASDEGNLRDFLNWLGGYLQQYTETVRAILQLQKFRVAANADIVVDGLLAQDMLIAEAAKAVGQFNARGKSK